MVHHHGLFFMHACRMDTIKRITIKENKRKLFHFNYDILNHLGKIYHRVITFFSLKIGKLFPVELHIGNEFHT